MKNRPHPKKMKILEPSHKSKERSVSAKKTSLITIRKKQPAKSKEKKTTHFNTNSNYTVDDDSKNHINLNHITDKKLIIDSVTKNYFTPKTTKVKNTPPLKSYSSAKRVILTNDDAMKYKNINDNLKKRNHSALVSRKATVNNNNELDHKFIKQNTRSVTKIPQRAKSSITLQNAKKITINIKSNWGHKTQISFFNISLLDINNKKIPPLHCDFDISKQVTMKYNKGEIKTINISFAHHYILHKISISNGYGDIGVCHMELSSNESKISWRGIIPKTNVTKAHIITLNVNSLAKSAKTNRIVVHRNNSNELKAKSGYDHIKFMLISNYGNRNKIGITGIELYNEENEINNLICSIRTNRNKSTNKYDIGNVIYKKNETKNLKNMFITDISYPYSNMNANVNIDIDLKECVNISLIKFYNFNFDNYLDCAVKEMKIILYRDKKAISTTKMIMLKPPGEDDIDYSQKIEIPFKEQIIISEETLTQFKAQLNNGNFNYFNEYLIPMLPVGFIIKIALYSTWGSNDYIGIDDLKIYEFLNEEDISDKAKIYSLPEKAELSKKENFYIANYINYNKKEFTESKGGNRILFMFNTPRIIQAIKISNYKKQSEIGAKEIKIIIDGKIVYEGRIDKEGESVISFIGNDEHKELPAKYDEDIIEEIETSNAMMINVNKI